MLSFASNEKHEDGEKRKIQKGPKFYSDEFLPRKKEMKNFWRVNFQKKAETIFEGAGLDRLLSRLKGRFLMSLLIFHLELQTLGGVHS